MKDFGFPEPRADARIHQAEPIKAGYDFVQASTLVTSANADGEVIRFAGQPDSIDLSASSFPAIFTLQDEMGVELVELHVPVGTPYTTRARAVRVLVRNAINNSNAIVSAAGNWHRSPQPGPAPVTDPEPATA